MEPERKKICLEEKNSKKRYKFMLECVLSDDLFCEVPTIEVHVGKIIDKKQIRKVILDLNQLHPVPNLQHLKRVNSNSTVLIGSCNDISDVEFFLKEIGFDNSLLCNYERIKVISKLPKTRKQFEIGNKLWPCNFFEDKYLEKLINHNLFSKNEVTIHKDWMDLCWKIAVNSVEKVGTVIVNPENNVLLCKTSSDRFNHPIKHSVMLAIDLIAKLQGGSAWPSDYLTNKIDNQLLGKDSYLCTGYYVYTTHEPCAMCAMALIHSRVKRVFYSRSTNNGSLGSIIKLHTVNSLNHHYEVFRQLH